MNLKPEEPSAVDLVDLHAGERMPLGAGWYAVALGLLCAGGIFLWFNSGGFSSDVYDVGISSVALDQDVGNDPIAAGQGIFSVYCAICHLPTGQGVPGQFPPLAGSEWVLGKDGHGDNQLVLILLDGLHDPVTVRGGIFNNVMVPWGQVMSDAQIAAVLSYVRQAWGNQAPVLSPAFVAQVRAEAGARSDSWTEKELSAVPRETAPLPTPTPSPPPRKMQ